ncbi:MAG: hypothetical protein IKW07_06540 [Clostridia bacterium]|jgi:hypothetical protein|nr:hypothetical protein [Clostridia bacterium]
MKKILSFALALSLLLGLLIGCSPKDDADYTGRYVLLPKGAEWSSLVVHWEYPDDDFDPILESAKVDLSPIEKYINPNADKKGDGVNLNNLLGTLGFNRSFLKTEPVGIDESGVKTIAKKKLPIYLQIESEDGRSVKVRLEYDKSIHD